MSKDVPSGSYVVLANVTIENQTDEETFVNCVLRADNELLAYSPAELLGEIFEVGYSEPVALVGTLPGFGGGTLRLNCSRSAADDPEDVEIGYIVPTIRAFKVDSLQ